MIGILRQRRKILRTLRDKKAFNKKTAVDPEEAGINYKHVLKLMERGEVIGKTSDGKIYLTEKGQNTW